MLSVIVGCKLYCWAQSVVRVSMDFERETFILFERSQSSCGLIYSCRWVAAVCGSGCWEKMRNVFGVTECVFFWMSW